MAPPQSSSRFEPVHLNLSSTPTLDLNPSRSESSTAQTSPIEPPSANSARFPLGSSAIPSVQGARLGAGSPSHEFGTSASGRLYSKRAREIQAAEGHLPLSPQPQIWGPLAHPPTSGNSTPLRETIPESPNGESFPDFNQTGAQDLQASTGAVAGRRARAGTLPSRFSPAGPTNGLTLQPNLSRLPNTSRPTPTTSPFKPSSSSTTPGEPPGLGRSASATTAAAQRALLSRLRAGSMPQRGNLLPTSAAPSPFGSSLFSTTWSTGRDRAGTLASIRSASNEPTSPAQSSFSRDGLADTDVKTLDYLGLEDTPKQPARVTLAPSDIEMLLEQQRASNVAGLADLTKNANRFRSYSVNAKEKYADGDYEDDGMNSYGSGNYSGSMTPIDQQSAAAYAIQEAVRQHNLEVQAFANYASAARPRARTAGVLDTPNTRLMRSYLPQQSRLDSSLSAADLSEETEYTALASAVQGLQLNGKPADGLLGDEGTLEGPTRALWLGNIPPSTTVSSLNVIFNAFGPIESSRVLTHKNCGFVNFENIDSAIRAKNSLNGKEIFPGAGGVRIGFAKVPSASGTPGHNSIFPSPSPDPLSKSGLAPGESGVNRSSSLRSVHNQNGTMSTSIPHAPPSLSSLRNDILSIVKELGGTNEEMHIVSSSIDSAIHFSAQLAFEIPPIPEPSHNRIHDAPRLREIRKRIDNNSYTITEIEDVAMNMLPEIAELSSDYLGNTVVQKLFEFTSDPIREAMLAEIARDGGLAEIGIHKNGTWAAQKIIDVSQSRQLQQTIVDSLRAFAVPLFLDQFGNYVVQGCLRYGAPLNNFIFESMASSLWELAQGRFGARAMRACLESHHATKEQQRMIAAAIAVHAVQLATNANGALLLTWFLDTATFPGRRRVLAPRLVEHLVELCTHKVAYLTVLKLINQRNEPEARDTILQALFFSKNDEVLEAILRDQACGATLIFKVLTTPFFDEAIRQEVVEAVRRVLLRIKAQPGQGYKRLMDEVGLSTRNGGGVRDMSLNREDGSRPASNQASQGAKGPGSLEHNYQGRVFPMQQQQAFDLQRTASGDSNFDQYNVGAGMPGVNGLNTPLYSPNPGMLPNTMQGLTQQQAQQLHYQQLLARQQQQAQQQPGFFNPQMAPGVNNMQLQGLPNMNGLPGLNAGFPSPAPSMDQFRNVASSPVVGMPSNQMPINSGSPMLNQLPQPGFPVYGQGMVNMGNQANQMYGYNGFPAQGMQMAGGVRRGRR